jgi:hypothetical protein
VVAVARLDARWDVGESPLPGYTRMRLTMEVLNGLDWVYFHSGVETKSEGHQQVCPSPV